MRKATVRDLRYRFREVEAMLREGEEIQITKRTRVIARLVPEHPAGAPPLPDFMGRMRRIFGDRKLRVSGAKLVRSDRDAGN